MSDISKAKKLTGSIFPEGAIDSGGSPTRVEPIITPDQLKTRFLFGVPMRAPATKQEVTNEMLKDYINRAIARFENDTKVTVTPLERRVRLPFDPNLYFANIWCEIPHKPIQKVKKLAICSASYSATPQQNDQYPSGAEIYTIPNEWIDVSYAAKGTIFVNPISPAFGAIGTQTQVSASGATVLQFIGVQGWVPAYWTAEVIVGYCDEQGNVPTIANEAIGAQAAILLIDNLIPLFRIASQSLGIDGLSQSVSDNMQNLLTQKRQALIEEYGKIVKSIKLATGNSMITSNV